MRAEGRTLGEVESQDVGQDQDSQGKGVRVSTSGCDALTCNEGKAVGWAGCGVRQGRGIKVRASGQVSRSNRWHWRGHESPRHSYKLECKVRR